MKRFRIVHKPVYSALEVTLEEGEKVVGEAGGMAFMDSTVGIETSARGGIFNAFKRALVGREAFFMNTFHGPGKIVFAPPYDGDIFHIPLKEDETWLVQGGSYMASSSSVKIDTKWGGFKGLLAEGNLFFLKIDGPGDLFLSVYGAIDERTLVPGERFIIDTGHLVGFKGKEVKFDIRRVGGWKSTFLSGEGIVTQLYGPCRLLTQTRSIDSFVTWLIKMLPTERGRVTFRVGR
ncbi:MAG: TIGR00266 family protein [Candidatus Bathyarchaeia archaeon]